MMKVAFTFDDGPHPDTTQRLLKEMKERGVKATFFLLGEKIEQYPGLAKEIAENGHQIGNHSYSHLGYAPEKEEAFLEEIRRTNRIIEEFVGKPCAFCRPPYGSWDDAVAKKCELAPVFWDVETRDWEIKDKEQIIREVEGRVKDGDVVLFHDAYETTVDAAVYLMDVLKEKGFSFVTVEELWKDNPKTEK